MHVTAELNALMDRWNLSSMYDSFVRAGIQASTMWNISEERLLQMEMPEGQNIKYRKAKKDMTEGKYNNTQRLPVAKCKQVFKK